MRKASGSGLSTHRYKILFLLVLLTCFSNLPLAGQKNQGTKSPAYDLHTEAKMKGAVDEVKLPPKGSEKEAIHLLVKIGTDTSDVYLCPKSFLDDMGMSFSKGDEIALTGSKVKVDGADVVLAREVVKGNDTLMIRDEKGTPVWNWQH